MIIYIAKKRTVSSNYKGYSWRTVLFVKKVNTGIYPSIWGSLAMAAAKSSSVGI